MNDHRGRQRTERFTRTNVDSTVVFMFDGEQFHVELTDDLLVLKRYDPHTGTWVQEARVTPRAATMLATIAADLDLDTIAGHLSPAGQVVVPFEPSARRRQPDAQPGAVVGQRRVRTHPTATRGVTAPDATEPRTL
jgi:hypothetical protein